MWGESLDSTAIAILFGVAVAVILAAWHAVRHQSINVPTIALDFLAVFGLLAAADLIWAAFLGDANALPSAWREYVAVAGVVGMGFALQHLTGTLAGLTRKPPAAAVSDEGLQPGQRPDSSSTSANLHQ